MTTEYLIELIKNNTRVILPEFGAFLIKDDGSGDFKPQNLTFSPFLRYNDGMLEDKLASKNKVTKDNAKDLLASYVEGLKQELTTNNTYELKGIGSLYLDKRGSIHFDPIGTKTTTATKIAEPGIKEEKPKKEEPLKENETPPEQKTQEKKVEAAEKPVVEKKTEEVVSKKTQVPEQKIVPPKAEPQKREVKTTKPIKSTPKPVKEKRPRGTGQAILIGTLIGLGFVFLLVAGWHLYDIGFFSSEKTATNVQTTIVQEQSTVLDETTTDDPIAKDESEEEVKTVTQQAGKFDDEFSKLSAEMDKTPTGQSEAKSTKPRISQNQDYQTDRATTPYVKEGIYHLIVGSFRNVNYAEKYSDDMKASGFKSRVITQPTGMHAVTLGSFLTRQEAEDSMNVWKAQHPNTWILNQ
ncbi:MAG TPA: hypothetical protein DG754_11040 [Bacteroidales bacterium]|jgi:cell division protein FtsN|nr:hypothetical protein [Bacteroidales bacterium]